MYTQSCSGERLESASSPPFPPRAFTGDDPLLSVMMGGGVNPMSPAQSVPQHLSHGNLLATGTGGGEGYMGSYGPTGSLGRVSSNAYLSGGGCQDDYSSGSGRSERLLRDVHSFVIGVVKHSALFWIVLTISRIQPLLRCFTFVPPWRLLSSVHYAVGSLVVVDTFNDLLQTATSEGLFAGTLDGAPQITSFARPVILVVRHVIGWERLPFNTAALVMGPTVIPKPPSADTTTTSPPTEAPTTTEALFSAPHLLSPLSIQARQMSILCAVAMDPNDFENLIISIRHQEMQIGETAEVFIPEHRCEMNIRPLRIESSNTTNNNPFDDTLTRPTSCATTSSPIANVVSIDCQPTVTVPTPPDPPVTATSPSTGGGGGGGGGGGSPTNACKGENDAVLAKAVLARLREPAPVYEGLPLQTGPMLPSLRYYCAQPLPALLATNDEDGDDVWGRWSPNSRFFQLIPVISPTLFDKLYITGRWFLTPKEFTPLLVGNRSLGFQALSGECLHRGGGGGRGNSPLLNHSPSSLLQVRWAAQMLRLRPWPRLWLYRLAHSRPRSEIQKIMQ